MKNHNFVKFEPKNLMIKRFYIAITFSFLVLGTTKAQGFESGAFGAPVIKYSKIVNQSALIIGGKWGWVINKRFSIGTGFYSLVTGVNTHYVDTQSGQTVLFKYNYGGLELEFLALKDSKFNVTIDMLLAGGGQNFYAEKNNNAKTNFGTSDFLLWEPQIDFEYELYNWLHIDAGLSYRMISSYNKVFNVDKNELEGTTFLLNFKFGKY